MIRKEQYIPTKKSRNELLNELKELKPGESLLISGEETTRRQVYLAASRARKRILTTGTPIGLRVWLNPKHHPAEMPATVPDLSGNRRDLHDERRSTIDKLKDATAAILERDFRHEIAREIDAEGAKMASKVEYSGPEVVDAEWIP